MAEPDSLHEVLKMSVIEQQIGALSEEMRAGFKQQRELIERMILLEERRTNDSESIKRCFTQLEAVSAEVDKIGRKSDRYSGALAVCGAAGGLVMSMALYIYNIRFEPLHKLPEEIQEIRGELQRINLEKRK